MCKKGVKELTIINLYFLGVSSYSQKKAKWRGVRVNASVNLFVRKMEE